jgi:hypothetical protein
MRQFDTVKHELIMVNSFYKMPCLFEIRYEYEHYTKDLERTTKRKGNYLALASR